MKLTQLQEAAYSGKRTMEQMMQFFWEDEELSDEKSGRLYFTRDDYIARNDAAEGECNEVWWIKLSHNRKDAVGIMYRDEHFDWITVKEFMKDFIIYKQQKVF